MGSLNCITLKKELSHVGTFNITKKIWEEVAGMKEQRMYSGCAVFEGNIVVSGGWYDNDFNLNTVESYDVIANKWTSMPNMVHHHTYHGLVVSRKKMFVFDRHGEDCEVFDGACKKFVSLKAEIKYDILGKILSTGNKIFIFYRKKSSVVCYDVDKNEWSEEPFAVTESLKGFSCIKVPCY